MRPQEQVLDASHHIVHLGNHQLPAQDTLQAHQDHWHPVLWQGTVQYLTEGPLSCMKQGKLDEEV